MSAGVCKVIEKHSAQHDQKRLYTAIKCKHLKENWLRHAFNGFTRHSDENCQLLLIRHIQPSVIQMRGAQTFWSAIVTIRAFHQSKDSIVLQCNLKITDILVVGLGTHSRQEIRAHHVIHDADNPGCNKFLLIVLLKRNGEVQDCLHKTHKSEDEALNPGHFIFKLA